MLESSRKQIARPADLPYSRSAGWEASRQDWWEENWVKPRLKLRDDQLSDDGFRRWTLHEYFLEQLSELDVKRYARLCVEIEGQGVLQGEGNSVALDGEPITRRLADCIARITKQQLPACSYRESIGEEIGRIVLTRDQVNEILSRYRGCWGQCQSEPAVPVIRRTGRGNEIKARVRYGAYTDQQWWLLRDVVVATKEARRERRNLWLRHLSCMICGRTVYSTWPFLAADGDLEGQECGQIILRRHFPGATPSVLGHVQMCRREAWIKPRKSERTYFRKRLHDYWMYYYFTRDTNAIEVGPPSGPICGPACEATRFSRWLGAWDVQSRQDLKHFNRERMDKQWISNGHKALKQVQQYLNRRA